MPSMLCWDVVLACCVRVITFGQPLWIMVVFVVVVVVVVVVAVFFFNSG